MRHSTLWVGALALVLAAGTALAQDDAKKQDKKKDRAPVRGLPTLSVLKDKCSLDEETAKKVGEIYAEAGKKSQELRKKIKDGGDKKAIGKEFRSLLTATVAKVNECLNEEQQKQFKELLPKKKEPKKKKKVDN